MDAGSSCVFLACFVYLREIYVIYVRVFFSLDGGLLSILFLLVRLLLLLLLLYS